MADLVRDGETIRRVVARLREAIDELSVSQRAIVQVTPRAFGGSSRGTSTHRQVERAYEAVQDTLSRLQATHDEFAAQLLEVDRRLTAVDEQARADAIRQQARLDEQTAYDARGVR